jgi:murein DD-endopeptidase MepM/ murein hydrolase activator NlpD
MAAGWIVLAIGAQPPALTITRHARSLQPGEVVRLTITGPAALDAVRVRLFDREWPTYSVDSRRWTALIGIDLDVASGTYVAEVEATAGSGSESATYSLRVLPKTFRTRTLTVNAAFVDPPESELARIAEESRELEAIYAQSTPKRWAGAFVRPVPQAANSAFGTRSVFNGEPRSPHAGADFRSPAGTPVKAPAGGRVALARNLYFSGNTVIIDHGLGLLSMFAHLSTIDVQIGDDVRAGLIVGRVGATGRVTGPHLHWSVRLGGARVDPLSLLVALR